MTDESTPNPAESPPTPGAPPPPPPPAGAAPPPPPAGGSGSGGISENRTVFLVLAYLGPLALIPFLLEKEDGEVQWHSKHGLVIFLAEILLGIALGIVFTLGNAVLPLLSCVGGCLVPVIITIPLLIFHVMCIMKALDGQRLLVPGLSEFADQF